MNNISLVKILQSQQATTHDLPQLFLFQPISVLRIGINRSVCAILHYNLGFIPLWRAYPILITHTKHIKTIHVERGLAVLQHFH